MNVFLERERLFAALCSGEDLSRLVRRMIGGSLACAFVYGLVLGVQVGGWQVLSSPIKLPAILLGTTAICVSALYVIAALAGARLRWLQVLGLALCSVSASSLAMAALLPIAAFWTHAARLDWGFVAVTHSLAFLLSGIVGSRFALEASRALLGRERTLRVMPAWLCIYGLVAQQMAWMFRPHFSPTSVFMPPLSADGSALETLARILVQWLR